MKTYSNSIEFNGESKIVHAFKMAGYVIAYMAFLLFVVLFLIVLRFF
jgi:hypothetical protein